MKSVTGTRARVLAAIRGASVPVTIEELAAGLDVHPNTIRFHTSALEDSGLVIQGRQATGGKGRPRKVYRASAQGARSGKRNYELLSKVLLEHLAAAQDPAGAARAAGQAWGAASADARGTRGRASSTQMVVDFLDTMDFEPEHDRRLTPAQVRLRNCPFRELVDTHQDLVCNLHAGLLDGLVDGRSDGVELIPFHSETACLVRLSPREEPA